MKIVLRSGEKYCFIGVYRAADKDSPVFNADFFPGLTTICLNAERLGLPVCVCGDFNAKIGSQQGPLGQVEEFFDLLPEASEREEICDSGISLLSTFSNLEYFRMPFAEGGRECLTFRVRPGEGIPREGGSVIDFVFFSLDLVGVAANPGIHVGEESNHVLLLWSIVTRAVPLASENNPPPEPPTSLTFDLPQLLQLSMPDSLLTVLHNPDSVSAPAAYSALLEFIFSFTKRTRTCTNSNAGVQKSKELRELSTVMRKVERLRVRTQDPARREFLGKEYTRLAGLWRAQRDLDRRRVAEELRSKFWSAHRSGNPHLAWKYARKNLSGKGGGIRTSATRAITREGWEQHFSSLFGGTDTVALAQSLNEISLPGVTVTQLDTPFEAWEVANALEKKKNHKAPGPDGIRIEFLRVFRYDDAVCQALANVFTILSRDCWFPSDWERAYLYVLYKGTGDIASVNSFRGIALKSHVLKLFESLLCARLTRWLDEERLLPEEQLAYRSGLSGVDHIYYLHVIRESEVARNGVCYAGFIDLRKAFPSVNRRKLLESLVNAGASDKTVSILRKLYAVDSFQLLLDGVPGTVIFTVVVGVHEGSSHAPSSFTRTT